MRTNSIGMAENSAKRFIHTGRLNKARRKLAPFVLLGGLLLSSPLRGQGLQNDSISIAKEQSAESVNQPQGNRFGLDDLLMCALGTVLYVGMTAGIAFLVSKLPSRGSEGAEAYNEFY